MSAAGSSAIARERIVPGHRPALEQVAKAPHNPYCLIADYQN